MLDYQEIVAQLRQNPSSRAVARKGLADRKTVQKIKEAIEPLGWLEPGSEAPSRDDIVAHLVQEPPVPARPSSVAAYEDKIKAWAEEGYQPKAIYDRLKRDVGPALKASVGSVKRALKRLRPETPEAYAVLHFEPGEAVQVDFGSGPELAHPKTGKVSKTYVFVMTLCDSRHMYAELVWDQKIETWLRCHRNAFEFFQGVPLRVIIDNLKSAITKACFREPQVQRSYEKLARDYGFQIDPCPPKRPRYKGRVERGVGYFKTGFLPLRQFRNFDDANQQLLEWVLGEAGNRIHGTTHEMPLRAFAEREKKALNPLPSPRPDLAFWGQAKLHPNCHLSFEKSYYSAPWRLVGKLLDVCVTDRMVEVYFEHEFVALHPRARVPGSWQTSSEHMPPEKVAHLMKTPQWCIKRARDVGDACHELVDRMLGDRGLYRLNGVQAVLGLAKRFGSDRLEAACSRALAYETINYRAVNEILKKGLDHIPDLPDKSGQLHFGFVMAPRFLRDLAAMLGEVTNG